MPWLKSIRHPLQQPGLVIVLALLSACSAPAKLEMPPETAPIRFLLTFDDGPSARTGFNPTAAILDDLANNPLQPGIKAVFFVQTRAAGALSPQGQALLQRQHDEGHMLGFHTATSWHAGHRFLSEATFEQSLLDGLADLHALGHTPSLVRPPFWHYNQSTFDAYLNHGMHLLLTDLSANDGKTWGINASPRRRSHLRNELARTGEEIRQGKLPIVDGVIPVVVTFHDLNTYTARRMQEYLQILLDAADQLGLRLDSQPFYSQHAELERAALARTLASGANDTRLPSIWNWLWR
jgi:peptidoglycan/xylan/chitin deacetylase (PgdA/CDA1 family)